MKINTQIKYLTSHELNIMDVALVVDNGSCWCKAGYAGDGNHIIFFYIYFMINYKILPKNNCKKKKTLINNN